MSSAGPVKMPVTEEHHVGKYYYPGRLPMSESVKPTVLTLLALLAVVTGIFSLIRGALMIFGGISQLMAGVGGVFEIIFGILSLAVGVMALAGGIKALRGASGWVGWINRYAAGLALYNVLWLVYSLASGGKISWLTVMTEVAIAGATLAIIRTSEDIRKYLESE
jgi:hypothetical protein